MKKLLASICIATLAISSAMAKELPEVKAVVPLTDLTLEKTKELLSGDFSDIAILCEAGTELPLKFLGNYGLISIKYTPNLTITVDQTFYVRYVGNKVYVSYDLVDWDKDFFKNKKFEANAGISPDKSHILVQTHLEDKTEESDE